MKSCVDNVEHLEPGIPKLVKYVTNDQFQEHVLKGNHLRSVLLQCEFIICCIQDARDSQFITKTGDNGQKANLTCTAEASVNTDFCCVVYSELYPNLVFFSHFVDYKMTILVPWIQRWIYFHHSLRPSRVFSTPGCVPIGRYRPTVRFNGRRLQASHSLRYHFSFPSPQIQGGKRTLDAIKGRRIESRCAALVLSVYLIKPPVGQSALFFFIISFSLHIPSPACALARCHQLCQGPSSSLNPHYKL